MKITLLPVIYGLIALNIMLWGCDERASQMTEKPMTATDNSNDASELLKLMSEKDSTSAVVLQSSSTLNQIYDRLLFLSSKQSSSRAVVRETAAMIIALDSLGGIVQSGKARLANIDAKLSALNSKNTVVAQTAPIIRQNIAILKSGIETQETSANALKGNVENIKKRAEKRIAEAVARAREQKKSDEAGNNQEVYYVVGTEKELLNKNIVREAGGTNLWIFGKLGVTLQPSKEVPQDEFAKFNPKKNNQLSIDSLMASAGKKGNKPKHFKIISAHNEKYIEPILDSTKTIRSFKINDEEKFWKSSPYLIIVVDEDE